MEIFKVSFTRYKVTYRKPKNQLTEKSTNEPLKWSRNENVRASSIVS